MQGVGRLMGNEFVILNEMKNIAVLSRRVMLLGDQLGCF